MDGQQTRERIDQRAEPVVRGVTIRSRWQDEGGRPVIVPAEPAEQEADRA